MAKITDFLAKRLPLLIILIAIGTFISPIYINVATWFPGLLLAIVIFFTGLSMNVVAIKGIKSKKRELLIATLLKWTLMVFVSIGLAYLFFSNNPEIAAGLILAGTVPSATSATVYTFLAGGNTSLVIAAALIDVLISPVVTPIAMMGIASSTVHISLFSLLKSFILIVILPLSIGLFIQRVAPQTQTYSRNITRLGSSLALLLIVHTIIGSGKAAMVSELHLLPLIMLATFIQVILPMGAAYVIAQKLQVCAEDAKAILFHVGLCNTALAAILAFQFIGELGAIAPIINVIFNLSIGAWVANYFARKEHSKTQQAVL